MIYAQRPNATACADFEFWNKRMSRSINAGSTGIALFDYNAAYPKMRYVFDISDTSPRKNAVPIQLWSINDTYKQDILASLTEKYHVQLSNNQYTFEDNLARLAVQMTSEYMSQPYITKTVPTDKMISLHKIALSSVIFTLYFRCSENVTQYDFDDLKEISSLDPRSVRIIGSIVNMITSQVFRAIEKTIH